MFSMFKKKSKAAVCSPVKGQLMPLSEVSDPVFSEGMMGPGFAVEPASDDIYSPITGIVTSVFPTKHAIGLEMSDGKEVLIHIGIDTVELQGQGFDILVSEPYKVTPETKLAVIDRDYLKSQGKESTIMVLFPGSTENFSIEAKEIKAGEEVV